MYDPIAEAPDAVWYVRPPTGGQFGPADGTIMRRWLNEGRVSAEALVWREVGAGLHAKGKIGEDNAALLGSLVVAEIYLSALSRVDQPDPSVLVPKVLLEWADRGNARVSCLDEIDIFRDQQVTVRLQ